MKKNGKEGPHTTVRLDGVALFDRKRRATEYKHADSGGEGPQRETKKTTANWLASADYDLQTAEAMLKARRYLYVVFMCHLAIEKTLKGL